MYRSEFEYTMFQAATLSVVQPDFEDREFFIEDWEYNKDNAVRWKLDVSKYNRSRKELEYFSRYSIDNIYEFYVFKSVVVNLNKLGNLQGKDKFSIGHHIPMALNGVHYPTNWTIQTERDNSNAKDHMPITPKKFEWEDQFMYILENMPDEFQGYKFIYLSPILLKLKEVY